MWCNRRRPVANLAIQVMVDRESYELGQRCAALLDKMLAHPVHAADVERIIADINPLARFPYRERREAANGRTQ